MTTSSPKMPTEPIQPDVVGNQRLFTKNFSFLVTGQIIIMLGSALLRFALSLYVLDTTGRADLFGLLFAISSIPLLFSPIAGAIADRRNRRNLLVTVAGSSALIAATLVGFLATGSTNIAVIGIVMVLLGTASAIEMPTVLACIPSLVPQAKLEQAIGLTNALGSIVNFAAPVAGGIIYSVTGLPILAGISSFAFLVGAALEWCIKIPKAAAYLATKTSFVATIITDLKEGFRYVIHQSSILKCLVLASALNLLLIPFFVVSVPVILRQGMHASDTWYGVGMALIEAGMVIGALSAGLFVKWLHLKTLHRWIVSTALAFIPVATALQPSMLNDGFLPSFSLFFSFTVLIMIVLGILSIYVITNIQRHTPDNLIGKVMAIMMAASQCAAPIGQLIYGFASERFSAALYIPTLGVGAATLLIGVASKVVMRSEDFDGHPAISITEMETS